MELRSSLKWCLFLISLHSASSQQNYDNRDHYDDRNRQDYDRNRDQYNPDRNRDPQDNYNRNPYDPYNRNNQTTGSNYDPYGRGNQFNSSNRYNSSDPYNRGNQYDPNDPYNRNKNDPYNRGNDPYNRANDPYNRDRQNDPYNRDRQNDPYNRDRQNDPYNRSNDPNNRSNDPYNRDRQNDPYNRDRQNDPYNRSNDPNNRSNDPYNRGNDPYNRDRNQNDRDGRYGQNGSNYGGSSAYGGGGGSRSGIDDGNCCQEYCYNIDEQPYVKLGSKTPYQFVYGKVSSQHVVPQCKPVQFWSVVREGTSLPDRMSIERYKRLQNIHDEIVRNYEERRSYPDRGRLCAEDYEPLKRWRWNDTISDFNALSLTAQGADDLKFLARRYQTRLRDLLVPYSENQYFFEYTDGDKSRSSFEAFTRGLFGDDAARVHANVLNNFNSYSQSSQSSSDYNRNSDQYSPFSSSNQNAYSSSSSSSPSYGMQSNSYGSQYDGMSNTYHCKTQEQRMDESRQTAIEYHTFKQKQDYKEMVRDVFRRLGFRHNLNDSIIEDMYDVCRYEKSWYVTRPSPWCAAFTKEHLKLLEYGDDLFYYYRSGYGHEYLNKNLGCGLVKDLYDRFERIVNGGTGEPVGVIKFRDIDTILRTMVALDIGVDASTLTADNYYQLNRRNWRTSDLVPFSGNLAAILYQCDNQNEKYKVMFFLNENPVDYPACSVGLCNWSTVQQKIQSLAQSCRLDWCERGAAYNNTVPTLFVVVLALFASIFN